MKKHPTRPSLWLCLLISLLSACLRQQKPLTIEPRETPLIPLPSAQQEHGSKAPQNFQEAKAILKTLFPSGNEVYCGCRYQLDSKDRIDEQSCGFRGHGARAHRIEWEHVVPASHFGRQFSEWTEGHPDCLKKGRPEKGRSCARKVSEEFRSMEANLFNLLPALGELNAVRSNLEYGEVPGERRNFGACDFEISRHFAEPRLEIRGDLARIYFFMDSRYPRFGILNAKNLKTLEAWDRLDPIDEKERERISLIEKAQQESFYIGRLRVYQSPAISHASPQPAARSQ